ARAASKKRSLKCFHSRTSTYLTYFTARSQSLRALERERRARRRTRSAELDRLRAPIGVLHVTPTRGRLAFTARPGIVRPRHELFVDAKDGRRLRRAAVAERCLELALEMLELRRRGLREAGIGAAARLIRLPGKDDEDRAPDRAVRVRRERLGQALPGERAFESIDDPLHRRVVTVRRRRGRARRVFRAERSDDGLRAEALRDAKLA